MTPTEARPTDHNGPIDIWDRGPRFRGKRYAVRLRHRDLTSSVVVSHHASRSIAVFSAQCVQEMLDSWLTK